MVWKVQTDTYQRELERYGEKTIEDSETLFWLDSEMMMDYLSIKKDFANEKQQLLFSLLAIDDFLDAFRLSNMQKISLLNNMQMGFKKEFDADKVLRKELDNHFRLMKNDIQSILDRTARKDYSVIFNVIEKKHERIFGVVNSIKKQLELSLEGFLMSHIHMMINRQYTSRQRQYELLIYDHLHRYYKTVENKSKFVKEKLFFESSMM